MKAKEIPPHDYETPDTITVRKLLRKIQKGDEDAIDDLTDLIDRLALDNLELIRKLKTIHTATKLRITEKGSLRFEG